MPKIVGYQYWVCEITPDNYTADGQFTESIRKLCKRDDIDDAQRIVDLLHNTSTCFEAYTLMAEPVWKRNEGEEQPWIDMPSDMPF